MVAVAATVVLAASLATVQAEPEAMVVLGRVEPAAR